MDDRWVHDVVWIMASVAIKWEMGKTTDGAGDGIGEHHPRSGPPADRPPARRAAPRHRQEREQEQLAG